MSVNSLLIEALNPTAPTAPDEYKGDAETYIIFNYTSTPINFGDDEPGHEIFFVQVHLYAPDGINTLTQRRAIKKALFIAGLTWPSYVNASDGNGQHHVFECELVRALGEE